MPRRDFLQDLQEASAVGLHPRLRDVKQGEDDGAIAFTYVPNQPDFREVDIQLLVSDISSYPRHHEYFVYSTSEDVPDAITEALQENQGILNGFRIGPVLSKLTDILDKTLHSQANNLNFESGNEHYFDMDTDAEMAGGLEYSDDEYGWSPQSPKQAPFGDTAGGNWSSLDDDSGTTIKMAKDLMDAKLAGFRVGYLGNPRSPILCISCRVGQLGISEEAMQAWKVDARQYLVCLIRYIDRYRPLEQIINEDASIGKSSVEVQVDLCDSYKPTLASAVAIFNPATKSSDTNRGAESDGRTKSRKMTKSFISKPLNSLLQERFVKILRYRHVFGFSWSGAEVFFNDIQGKSVKHADPADPKYLMEERMASASTTLPGLVTSDHLLEKNGPGASFPLIAMQFVLRHFVRCTEFCLVCHCKTDNAFEALKPYVCSKSLCLFQYMSLGFGPSLEWEILTQPYVVDLLISFTYISAKQDRLPDFPTGLGILVPPAAECNSSSPVSVYEPGNSTAGNDRSSIPNKNRHLARLDITKMELIFPNDPVSKPIRSGDWVAVVDHPFGDNQLHCRVEDSSLWPTVQLCEPIIRASPDLPGDRTELKTRPGYEDVKFVVYDRYFDEMDDAGKCAAVTMLLDTLPSVAHMQSFLAKSGNDSEPVLGDWKEKISRSALDVLRWIVASNRSCIMEDDQQIEMQSSNVVVPSGNPDSRVFGMEGYVQFRFAQGAPDKEERFVQSVKEASERLHLDYPTIFAWHGSSIGNWHGILREGLHYKQTMNGRAYGHGVYMSPHFSTSLGYTGSYRGHNTGGLVWPQSTLKITTAISLNEVVNAPGEFVSQSPHFVVDKLDWIQTRYLFVSCGATHYRVTPAMANSTTTAQKPSLYFEQDPARTAIGPSGQAIIIPINAVSEKRRSAMKLVSNPNLENKKIASAPTAVTHVNQSPDAALSATPAKPAKKRLRLFGRSEKNSPNKNDVKDNDKTKKKLPPVPDSPLPLYDDDMSEDTDTEDLVILLEADKEHKGKEPIRAPAQPEHLTIDQAKTDFVPGTLDGASLPLLGPPSYATPGATKALQRDLKTTLQIQDTHPLHELGWYIDPELINTVYQWIVELHSFDASLPLAADLKRAGLTSIVLELRFPKNYPISPPFVRVIRPRFLNFLRGGGGHVTAGGALCMELLTNSGWSAVSSIESVLLQVRMAISSTEPNPAKLDEAQLASNGTVRSYGVGEAMEAFLRACRMHGWEPPQDFAALSQDGGN
ncbi:hypothetical protein AJ80_07344 [Polytolypa hystricis UAMH7299]|uniref:UBC core domain-containing protein n=1 Tax=Polytolypa hystricis (strain UAMH7299) TaxID=1447883 RepID=A0A2B7XQ51_POLH7|nr:hypothetical protein AJ80_07344 [Polytolypa hystricis UAMH7299]